MSNCIGASRSLTSSLIWPTTSTHYEVFDLDPAKLYSLTSVPPEKQKILYKGKVIKDDSQLKSLEVTDGATIMLMGTAEGKGMDIENLEKKVFLEELTDAEKAKYFKENLGVLQYLLDYPAIWACEPW
jgi:hypothetical protein